MILAINSEDFAKQHYSSGEKKSVLYEVGTEFINVFGTVVLKVCASIFWMLTLFQINTFIRKFI